MRTHTKIEERSEGCEALGGGHPVPLPGPTRLAPILRPISHQVARTKASSGSADLN